MISKKFFSWPAGTVVCLLLLAAGCTAPVAQETAILELRYAEHDSTTYKLITEAERSVKFEGHVPDEVDFKGGRTSIRVEMTFTQQIQSTDAEGNAVARITLKGLKYLSIVKDRTRLDFDSSRERDKNSPLARLIGQYYTIRIAPTGQILSVVNASLTGISVRSRAVASETALGLFQPKAIKERHGVMFLPFADKNQLSVGESWSRIKNFSFGVVGSKSYEKIYTLKEIKRLNNQRIALAEMSAIPAAETASQVRTIEGFSKRFDSIETYTGRLRLNLTASKVEEYFEKLQAEWTIVDPSAERRDDEEPTVLRMRVTSLYSLEKID